MASPLRVPLLLATLVSGLTMTPMALKPYLPGGLEDSDISDEDVQKAVEFALQEYNNDSNDLYLSSLVRVVRARQQVVAGMNFHLDLEIGRTTCVKNKSSQVNCPLSEEPKQLCSFVVSSRARNKYSIVKKSKCRKA